MNNSITIGFYRILGTFRFESGEDYGYEKGGYFSGKFYTKDGKLTGTLEDCWGESKISGEISQNHISFQKKYDESAKSKNQVFNYVLMRRTPEEGFTGSWKNENGEEKTEGLAFCAISFAG